MLASIDWTSVLVVGVPSILSAIFAGVAMLRTGRNARLLHVPSGGTIGEKVELTHDLAAVSVKTLHKLNGGSEEHG